MAHAGRAMWPAAARPPPVEAARLSLSLRGSRRRVGAAPHLMVSFLGCQSCWLGCRGMVGDRSIEPPFRD
ncbi:hypothetical protein HS99_0004695 [Kitasatospora aureofaciens]|uniref:Uncharacterized protein n=1 Tax=Kitasatospora aureofaciens TaxID=1894 RepID=A0A1E7N8W1_KITAU|nr:hypothetical protein HS99_0004695 [Kitasatospora aureofaciens]